MIGVTRDGETVDALCWRILGQSANVTEQTYAANPGMADIGPRLPGGTRVTLPDVTAITATVRQTVKLWDLG